MTVDSPASFKARRKLDAGSVGPLAHGIVAGSRAGVRKYLIWRAKENVVNWFMIEADRYVPLPPHEQGILESRAFPGLLLDVQALLARNAASVLKTLQAGLGSQVHDAFAARLKATSQA